MSQLGWGWKQVREVINRLIGERPWVFEGGTVYWGGRVTSGNLGSPAKPGRVPASWTSPSWEGVEGPRGQAVEEFPCPCVPPALAS